MEDIRQGKADKRVVAENLSSRRRGTASGPCFEAPERSATDQSAVGAVVTRMPLLHQDGRHDGRRCSMSLPDEAEVS